MYLPSEDNSLERLDMFPDETVALKITLPGSVHDDGLKIYRLTDESDEPVPVEYDIINRNGEKYAIFDTDELGYFALFDTEEGYSDVSSDAWYAQGVKYATENGYMRGIGNNKFAPAAPILRCELVKVLYKMSGEPEIDAQSDFKDIMAGSEYEDAVAWAVENNIVAGYTEDKFEPYKNVTREQLATILQRYEKYKGADVYGNADITNYTDADDVSEYALAAVKWACNAGIISGIDGALVPKGNVTRAQLAVILERMG
jgi:hypothetical protein